MAGNTPRPEQITKTATFDHRYVTAIFASTTPEKELGAYARLMDAAPDLLAALEQLTRFCVRPGDDDKHDDGYDLGKQMAREAIAKAKGQ